MGIPFKWGFKPAEPVAGGLPKIEGTGLRSGGR
jgi:hypothetical protein